MELDKSNFLREAKKEAVLASLLLIEHAHSPSELEQSVILVGCVAHRKVCVT